LGICNNGILRSLKIKKLFAWVEYSAQANFVTELSKLHNCDRWLLRPLAIAVDLTTVYFINDSSLVPLVRLNQSLAAFAPPAV
jgi:hypothetical protein